MPEKNQKISEYNSLTEVWASFGTCCCFDWWLHAPADPVCRHPSVGRPSSERWRRESRPQGIYAACCSCGWGFLSLPPQLQDPELSWEMIKMGVVLFDGRCCCCFSGYGCDRPRNWTKKGLKLFILTTILHEAPLGNFKVVRSFCVLKTIFSARLSFCQL